jgi:stage II sporulation protein D
VRPGRADHRLPPPAAGRCRVSGLLSAATRAACFLLALSCASCWREIEIEAPPKGVPLMRVMLLQDADTAKIAIAGSYEILLRDGHGGARTMDIGSRLSSLTVRCEGVDTIVEGLARTQDAVEFVPKRTVVEVNGKSYRGIVRVTTYENASRVWKLRVVNVVDVESYLRGVVPAEMYPSWPAAALEAQAVAARTYALAKRERRTDRPYDVAAGTVDQAYGGYGKEDSRTDRAVKATAGQALTYRGELLMAYYHSCCGGHTADARQVFADSSPPLRGAVCGYCDKAPGNPWTVKMSGGETAQKLGVSDLTGLGPQGVGLDGRVAQVQLHRTGGEPQVIAGTAFRSRLGLNSARFTIRADGNYFIFEGRGWGHGVGLCQWGARGMAAAEKTSAQILEHYYPGAKIEQRY